MSTATDDAADDYREALDEVIDFTDTVTAEQWESVTSEEGWTVAATIHHIALRNGRLAEWVEAVRAGDPIELTADEQDTENAQHAEEFAKANRAATLELLRTGGEDTESLVRSLSEDEAAAAVPFGPDGSRPTSALALVGAAADYIRTHLDHARAAAGEDPTD
jgi:antitoxin (DNA-binding transcriptional repressor) of toxin-antitoxin stability system